jgi:glycosyltransferase involved in cell wall biosynthesis
MALGKPVIATGYSGNLDFMTPENSYLVDYALGTVPPGCEPYPVGAHWAEADLDQAAALMRRVHEMPDEAARRGQLAREHVLTQFSPAVCGGRVARRLAQIEELRRARAAPGEAAAEAETPAAAAAAPVEGPSRTRRRLGGLRAAYRGIRSRLRP